MAEKGPPAPRIPATPKPTRSKKGDQTKGKETSKNPPKQNPPEPFTRTKNGNCTCKSRGPSQHA